MANNTSKKSSSTFSDTKESTKKLPFLTLCFTYGILADGQIIPTRFCFFNEEVSVSFSILKPEFILSLSKMDPTTFQHSFVQESEKLLFLLLEKLFEWCKKQKIKYVYFDSYKRTVGVSLIRSCILGKNLSKWNFDMLMRTNVLYELSIQKPTKKREIVFRLRDYQKLLDSPVEILYKDFVDSETQIAPIRVEEFVQTSLFVDVVKEKMSQEELVIRTKAFFQILKTLQNYVFTEFIVDVIQTRTISSLAMRIFTTHFLPNEKLDIYTNSVEDDAFIREAYFGGHTEVYRPRANNVFVYDVNSIYPFTMCKDMPSYMGTMIYNDNNLQLDKIFGFVEATIDCPAWLRRPFLPFRNKEGVFYPTGKWKGVYFSEELKYAVSLGYKVEIHRVLLFTRNASPLRAFVTKLYTLRLEAKKEKKRAAQLIYKLILVSLYGRFGFKPDFEVAKVVNDEELQFYINHFETEDWTKMLGDLHLLTYKQVLCKTDWAKSMSEKQKKVMNKEISSRRKQLRFSNTAVHLAAAITSYARIHMYQYIQDESVVYTDTDSIITTKPLPEEDISSTELGKMKLESEAVEYVSPRGKFFILRFANGTEKVVKSGLGKEHVNFLKALELLNKEIPLQNTLYSNVGNTSWKNLSYKQTERSYVIGISSMDEISRKKIYDESGIWVDTKPRHIPELE